MEGGTPLAVIDTAQVLGLIYLKDTVKPGIRDQMLSLRRAGIKTIMVTGDNRLTAATIAAEAGVEDFVPEAKPEDKIRLIRDEQEQGRLVAMTGDGTNDAPALAQADGLRVTEPTNDLLSTREREVLACLAQGRSNREIAAALSVTLATVKSHLVRIYAKLEAGNRNEALGRAVALGLLN